jgi:hypothetical protein
MNLYIVLKQEIMNTGVYIVVNNLWELLLNKIY